MGTPETVNACLDALCDWSGRLVPSLIRQRFPAGSDILDVGAGWGKYAVLLLDYNVDAVEIWEPNVFENDLGRLYREVIVGDVCDVGIGHYDAIIMGDVFEHIDRWRCKDLLSRLRTRCDEIYVVVPFLYPQGPEEGNPFEVHVQDDLTPELMEQEYPELRPVEISEGKGLYSWR